MKAITLRGFGDPDVLEWRDVPDPRAGYGEVVLEIAAAGVNRADLLQRRGRYPPPPGASDILGLECAGRVIEVGPGVGSTRIGEEVCALLPGGGYAERVAVPVELLLPRPSRLSWVEAAALPEAACTVWSMVFMAAGARRGQRLLVHGGASGIGTFAVQLAVAMGLRVAATAGSAAKCERVRELGAELVVNYRDDDFVAAIEKWTAGGGVDVVLDIVGATYLQRNLAVLADDGHLVVIATQGGRRGELDLGMLMARRGWIHAAGLRSRPLQQKAEIIAQVREHVWPLVDGGAIRPVIEAAVPMEDAAYAHRILEAGTHVGKVILLTPWGQSALAGHA
ncbi:MAG: NAD(P)H-quinone oxidoreductase [Acidothermus sp.]|nr:NAD(P)H-quinone oxidoreductase [Acidothermus sp.]